MATISDTPPRHAEPPEPEPAAGLDPGLLYARTGMTDEELQAALDRMSLEELAALEEILTAIDLGLLIRDPAVRRVLGRSEAFLHRAEALAEEVVGGP